MKLNIICIKLLAATVLLASQAQAAPYNFTALGTPLGLGSGADAINNAGRVAGYSNVPDSLGGRYGQIWDNGIPATLATLPGERFNSVQAINNHGVAVGSSTDDDVLLSYFSAVGWHSPTAAATAFSAGSHAFGINDHGQVVGSAGARQFSSAILWSGNSRTDLGSIMGSYSIARAINNSGQIVGESTYAYDSDQPTHAALWFGDAVTDLGTLGGTQSGAADINAAGNVVGWSEIAGSTGRHAALWTGGTAVALDAFGGIYNEGEAKAINSAGLVVGFASSVSGGGSRAALWRDGTAIDLNSLLGADAVAAGWVLQTANDINDLGWIVGNAYNASLGLESGYILAPVPEPETYAMLMIGLGLLGWLARRRRAGLDVAIPHTRAG
jgi:probable HAF family extracellular repeat protein